MSALPLQRVRLHFNQPRVSVLLSLIALCLVADAQLHEPQIAGRVVRADNGLPIEGAAIELVPPLARGDGQLESPIADSHGEYRFLQGVSAGTYAVKASAEGFVSQTYSRDATLEGEFQRIDPSTRLRGIDFRLKREASIHGVVTDSEGKPAGIGISVAAVQKEKWENGSDRLRPATWVKTDASGRFALTKLSAGTYFACVNGPNGFDAVSAAGGWYRETWYGNVSSAEGAAPIALKEGDERDDVGITVERERRYSVIVWPSGPEGEPKPDSYDLNIPDRSLAYSREADGSYVIPGVPPGHYRLVSIAWTEGQYSGEGDIKFDVTNADVTLHLRVGGLGEIQGVVKSDDTPGKVPSGLMLGIESQEGAAQGSNVDTGGHFMIGRVLPGEYRFKLLKKPVGFVLRGVRCGGAEVTPDAPLRVGDRQKVTDCEALVGQETSGTEVHADQRLSP
jgi:hypothetical protein